MLGQEICEVADALDHPRLDELLLVERVGQPLGNVAGSLKAAAGRGIVGPAGEPVGAEAAVGILQAERVVVKVLDKRLGPLPLAGERLAALLTLADGVT